MEFLQAFEDLFGGRKDGYAKISKIDRGKASYVNVQKPLTRDVLVAHMRGEVGVGIYPIVDNKVNWGLIDIDGPKGPDGVFLENGWEEVWEKAVKQAKALRDCGLHAYIERSRSGKGAHVWIFLDDWVPAAKVRAFLYSKLVVEKKTFEIVYPVQASSDGWGSLIALPFNGTAVKEGNSVFLDDAGEPIAPKAFMAAVRKNSSVVFDDIVVQEKESKPGEIVNLRPALALRGALKTISPYGCKFMHNAWVTRKTISEPEWYLAIQQATCFNRGLEFAHAISRDYPKYNKAEVDRKFQQAMSKPVAGCSYIREHYPHLACANCPGKAPYEVANKSLIELARESSEEMEAIGDCSEDLELIRQYDAGEKTGGIDWGVPLISKHHRLRDSEMVVVGGFPSLGKTWFLIDNAIRMAKRGVVVFIFSAETARKQLRQRLISNLSGVDLGALRGQRGVKLSSIEWSSIRLAAAELEELPIYIDYTSMSPNQVINQIEDVVLSKNIPLDAEYVIFFDYLQFGFREPGEESDTDRIGRLAGEFKIVSKVLEHPSVILSQLKRDKEINDEDEEVRPDLNWFANSANIERTADSLFIITGKRIGGLYAPRTLWKVKDRDGEAPMSDKFVLQQPCGGWREPVMDIENRSENLLEGFNV